MEVRLDRLGEEPFEWQETLVFTPEELQDPNLVALGEVDCRGRITATSAGFLLQATIAYEQTLTCTRCLGRVVRPISGQLDLLIEVAPPATVDAEEKELADEDLGLLVLERPIFETRGLVGEQILLEVPMKVLCRDDCAGLCETCGADLNQGACRCTKEPDPRWSALAKLKDNH